MVQMRPDLALVQLARINTIPLFALLYAVRGGLVLLCGAKASQLLRAKHVVG